MASQTFVGFGFGAIQAGLFLYEAHRSGNFGRLVVAEVVPETVAVLRRAGGRYGLNVATDAGIERHEVAGVELLNPCDAADRPRLVEAIADAAELATALPSIDFYNRAGPGDVAALLAEGFARRAAGAPAVIYTAENHNHAAEHLTEALAARGIGRARVQCLNTVIGKMSGVVGDAAQIAEQALLPIAADLPRAFLVEAFNRILIGRIALPGFARGITVFDEKDDLLPFEEAKLYGHNAAHALLGYLLHERRGQTMADAVAHGDLMQLVREAFNDESGGALCRRHAGVDPLFTAGGFRAYVDDLMRRMVNPHLRDRVERITRDAERKLGWDDRLIGTMRLALAQGIAPWRYARGARAALATLEADAARAGERLASLWPAGVRASAEAERLRELILERA